MSLEKADSAQLTPRNPIRSVLDQSPYRLGNAFEITNLASHRCRTEFAAGVEVAHRRNSSRPSPLESVGEAFQCQGVNDNAPPLK